VSLRDVSFQLAPKRLTDFFADLSISIIDPTAVHIPCCCHTDSVCGNKFKVRALLQTA
jgi:hypothetical protein